MPDYEVGLNEEGRPPGRRGWVRARRVDDGPRSALPDDIERLFATAGRSGLRDRFALADRSDRLILRANGLGPRDRVTVRVPRADRLAALLIEDPEEGWVAHPARRDHGDVLVSLPADALGDDLRVEAIPILHRGETSPLPLPTGLPRSAARCIASDPLAFRTRLRHVTPDTYGRNVTTSLGPNDWPAIEHAADGRPILLVFHGTGLQSHDALAPWGRRRMEALAARYPVILAFDHRTLDRTVQECVSELLDTLPRTGRLRLRLHVLGLSRGGLLARWLSEGWASFAPHSVRIERVVFVSSPNDGTPTSYWKHLCYVQRTRCLEHGLPADVLDSRCWSGLGDLEYLFALLAASRQQVPGSRLFDRLNGRRAAPPDVSQPDAVYFGLASRYPTGLLDAETEQERSRVFGDADNDLMVPTRSTLVPALRGHWERWERGRLFPLPAERVRVFGVERPLTHRDVPQNDEALDTLLDWLPGG